jgi:hypothetical protein
VSWFVQGRRPDLPLPMARRTRAFVPNPSRPSSWAHITEAIENHRMPDPGRFRSLVVLFYKASSDYAKLAGSTRKNWSPWLDRIADCFGGLRVAHFDRLEKIPPGGATNGPISRAWPIMGCKFYSRVLSHAADPLGKIAGNCRPFRSHLDGLRYRALKKTCPAEAVHAVDLASHTGLRLRNRSSPSAAEMQNRSGMLCDASFECWASARLARTCRLRSQTARQTAGSRCSRLPMRPADTGQILRVLRLFRLLRLPLAPQPRVAPILLHDARRSAGVLQARRELKRRRQARHISNGSICPFFANECAEHIGVIVGPDGDIAIIHGRMPSLARRQIAEISTRPR